MIGKFNALNSLEQGSGLIPNVKPDAFAVAPQFDSTEDLRVEIDETDETRPVRYTSDIRLILHTKDLAYRDWETDRKSTRLNSSHITRSRMPSSA